LLVYIAGHIYGNVAWKHKVWRKQIEVGTGSIQILRRIDILACTEDEASYFIIQIALVGLGEVL
jgi:hypothetical protein